MYGAEAPLTSTRSTPAARVDQRGNAQPSTCCRYGAPCAHPAVPGLGLLLACPMRTSTTSNGFEISYRIDGDGPPLLLRLCR